jgi:hypothetical protein
MKKELVPLFVPAADMTTTQHSIGVEINQEYTWSIQAVWTGAPVGVLTIEVSNDNVPLAPVTGNPVGPNPAALVTNWSTYTGSAVPVTGTSGNWTYIAQLSPYKWVRLTYTAASGTGSLTANLFGKG